MFQGIKNGWDVIFSAIHAFRKHPVLLVPLLIVWAVYAPTVIYLKWHFDWAGYSKTQLLWITFFIIYFFALLLTLSCSVLLELIQQKETGQPFSLQKSLAETLTKNIVQTLTLALLWAIVWMILTLIEVALSDKKHRKSDEENAENIARTLAGSGSFSWTDMSIGLLKKGARMIVFLIMPAFAWEDMSTGRSLKRGFSVLRQRTVEFISGYTLSYLAGLIVFIPPGIMFYIADRPGVDFPDGAWMLCILYISFAWSFTIYLEQMFTAELYLWQMKWEQTVRRANELGQAPPEFSTVKPPSILDDVADLAGIEPDRK